MNRYRIRIIVEDKLGEGETVAASEWVDDADAAYAVASLMGRDLANVELALQNCA